jgi:group I intron endonuclease
MVEHLPSLTLQGAISMDIYSIYRATNIINSKVYIGFTKFTTDQRAKAHLKNSKSISNKFYNAIKKYGWENFIWETIYQSKDYEHTLTVMENYFITEHDSFKKGYNSTLGGDGVVGYSHTEETRNQISNTVNDNYSNMTSEERSKKFGKPGTENPFHGKTHDDETSLRMKASHAIQRTLLVKCEECGKEVDAQNYALHHGSRCGSGSAVRGRKWYHSLNKESYYLLPTDSRITELNLELGRVTKNKLGRPKVKV